MPERHRAHTMCGGVLVNLTMASSTHRPSKRLIAKRRKRSLTGDRKSARSGKEAGSCGEGTLREVAGEADARDWINRGG